MSSFRSILRLLSSSVTITRIIELAMVLPRKNSAKGVEQVCSGIAALDSCLDYSINYLWKNGGCLVAVGRSRGLGNLCSTRWNRDYAIDRHYRGSRFYRATQSALIRLAHRATRSLLITDDYARAIDRSRSMRRTWPKDHCYYYARSSVQRVWVLCD